MGGKGGGGDSPDTVTHINRNVPEWVEAAGKELFPKAQATLGKPAEERVYQGQRTAGASPLTQTGLQSILHSQGKYEPGVNEAAGLIKNQYNTPHEKVQAGTNTQRISTNRFTDPNSGFNQYIEKIYNPMEKRLQQTADRALKRENLTNAFSGRGAESSYGKSRQDALQQQRQDQIGMLQAQALQNANQIFQEDEKRALQAQLGQAGINQQDLDRMMQAQTANQTAGLQNKNLNLTAGRDLLQSVLSKYNMNNEDINRLLTGGQAHTIQEQKEFNSARERFNEMSNHDRTELEWILRFLSSNPGGTTSGSQTQSGGGVNAPLQFAGAALPLISNFVK